MFRLCELAYSLSLWLVDQPKPLGAFPPDILSEFPERLDDHYQNLSVSICCVICVNQPANLYILL